MDESELCVSIYLSEYSKSRSVHALVMYRMYFPSCTRFALASHLKMLFKGQQSSENLH